MEGAMDNLLHVLLLVWLTTSVLADKIPRFEILTELVFIRFRLGPRLS